MGNMTALPMPHRNLNAMKMQRPAMPQTGLIGAEQAQRQGLQAALGGLQQGFGQARGDIMRMLGGGGGGGAVNVPGGSFRAADFSNAGVGEAIQQGVAGLQGFANPGQAAMAAQAALSGAQGLDAQRRAFADFAQSPEQAFIREEQERAVLRNAAATGGLGGGNVLEELQRRAAGRAAQDINNRFARLGQVSGQGLQAAGQIGQLRGQEAGLANALNIARGQAGTQANIAGGQAATQAGIAGMQTAAQRAIAGAQLLGGLGQQGGLTAADMAFRTGQSLGAGRTRAGEQIAGNIAGTTSNLANLINQQGQGLSGIVGTGAGNLAGLLQGFGMSQGQSQEQLAALLSNIATGSASQVAGLPGIPGVQQQPGALGGLGRFAGGLGTLLEVI